MKTKQWDKDIEKGVKHKTALDLIEEYWNHRREEIYKEIREEMENKK
jgi:hypothetical protein